MYKPHVQFFNRHGKMLREATYIDTQSAYTVISKHMAAHPANIVKIGGRLCFTPEQADKHMLQQTGTIA